MAAEQMPWLTALTALRPVDDPAFHTLAQTGVGKEMSGGESKADAAADARSQSAEATEAVCGDHHSVDTTVELRLEVGLCLQQRGYGGGFVAEGRGQKAVARGARLSRESRVIANIARDRVSGTPIRGSSPW
jgi:hypothetical protein